jgi:hypothetical protein
MIKTWFRLVLVGFQVLHNMCGSILFSTSLWSVEKWCHRQQRISKIQSWTVHLTPQTHHAAER